MKSKSFTLIEVLLALALAALVSGLAGGILVGSAQTGLVAERKSHEIERAALLFDRLARDFEALLPTPFADEPAVELFGHQHPVLQLRALATVSASPEALHTPRLPCLVRYRRDHGRGGLILIRERLDATRPGSPAGRETIATGLEDVHFELLVGSEWKNRYAGQVSSARECPRAVRIVCRWAGQDRPHERAFVLRQSELLSPANGRE